MNIKEQENKLFARWAEKYEGLFMEDGAPCPEQFESERVKITYVLKEAYAPGESWDMRDWVAEYGGDSESPNTWNNLTRWTQAILEGGDYPQQVSIDDRIRWLKRMSFLNLKKVGGFSSATPAKIRKYAKDDAIYIYDQLRIYEPDIIVCCGVLGNKAVSDCLAEYVFSYEGEWEHYEKDRFFCWFYTQIPGKTGKTAVLNFVHPLNIGKGYTNEAVFTIMAEASKKILEVR